MPTLLGKKWTCSSNSYRLLGPLPHQWCNVKGSHTCAGNHSCCELMNSLTILCSENMFFAVTLPSSSPYSLFALSRSPEPWMGDANVLFRVKSSTTTITYWHFGQLQASALTTAQEILGMKPGHSTNLWVYGYSEDNLTMWPFCITIFPGHMASSLSGVQIQA